MRLGGSLRRRREGAGRVRGTAARILLGLLVLGAGFGGGYALATEVLFPAPEPPGDLTEVPALQGADLAEARSRVRRAGLTEGPVDSLKHPVLPAGTVVGQNPLPGQRAAPGDTVRMTVSLGPERRPVPDVTRIRSDRARTVLDATGFAVTVDSVESSLPRGAVVELAPEPGTDVTLPGEVRLTVSLGPPRVPMPILLGMRRDDAVATLDSVGLTVGEVSTRFRFGLDQGIVIEQNPAAGTMVERGAAVRIVVGSEGGG